MNKSSLTRISQNLGFLFKLVVFRIYFDEKLSEFHEPDPQTKFREISYQTSIFRQTSLLHCEKIVTSDVEREHPKRPKLACYIQSKYYMGKKLQRYYHRERRNQFATLSTR